MWVCVVVCVILHQHPSRRYQITQQIMNIDKQFNFFLRLDYLCVCLVVRERVSVGLAADGDEKMIYLGSVRAGKSLHPQIDFSKAINFVCHSYNLTDFSLWLMMATVDLQDISILTIIPYRSHSFASHNAVSFFLERARKYRLISASFTFSSLCASRMLLSKLYKKIILAYALSREKERIARII